MRRGRRAGPRLAAAALAALLGGGCAGWPFGGGDGPRPDVSKGVEIVDAQGVVEFYARASSFYGRLAGRRFNSLSTYQDPGIRGFFQATADFADYYANLAQSLEDAHFERNRPVSVEVLEFALEGPGRAKVSARILGDNGLPLRVGKVGLALEDRWERRDGQWWLLPGKL